MSRARAGPTEFTTSPRAPKQWALEECAESHVWPTEVPWLEADEFEPVPFAVCMEWLLRLCPDPFVWHLVLNMMIGRVSMVVGSLPTEGLEFLRMASPVDVSCAWKATWHQLGYEVLIDDEDR